MMPITRLSFLTTLLTPLAFFLSLVAGCGHGEEGAAKAGPLSITTRVSSEKAVAREVLLYLDAVGTVRTRRRTVLSAKIQATIQEVLVREGDRVSGEQVLVRLDDADARAMLRRAEATLDEAKESVVEAERGILAIARAVEGSRAQDELSRITYERQKNLFERRAVTEQARDEALARYRMSNSELARVVESKASLEAKRRQALARIAQAEAEITRARIVLQDTIVRSPMSGIVVTRNVEVGNLASPGTPLFTLDEERYRLEAQVPELERSRIMTAEPVVVSVGLTTFTSGSIAEVIPAADVQSRTLVVKVNLPDSPELRTGRYGVARFVVGKRERLDIPRGALTLLGQLEALYVIDPQQIAHLRLVRTGAPRDERVEVLSGLAPGETVATSGLDLLHDGCRVESVR